MGVARAERIRLLAEVGDDRPIGAGAAITRDLHLVADERRLRRAIDELSTRISDTLLVLGESVREVIGPAYRIGRTAAEVNPEIRRALGTAITFYSAASREQAREKKKAGKIPTEGRQT